MTVDSDDLYPDKVQGGKWVYGPDGEPVKKVEKLFRIPIAPIAPIAPFDRMRDLRMAIADYLSPPRTAAFIKDLDEAYECFRAIPDPEQTDFTPPAEDQMKKPQQQAQKEMTGLLRGCMNLAHSLQQRACVTWETEELSQFRIKLKEANMWFQNFLEEKCHHLAPQEITKTQEDILEERLDESKKIIEMHEGAHKRLRDEIEMQNKELQESRATVFAQKTIINNLNKELERVRTQRDKLLDGIEALQETRADVLSVALTPPVDETPTSA